MKNLLMGLSLAGLVLLAGCSDLDVVAKVAVTSFDALAQKVEPRMDGQGTRWEITSQGGEIFRMALKFAGNTADLAISIDASPLVTAGLDVTKLPANYSFTDSTARLDIAFDLGDRDLGPDASRSMNDAFKSFISLYRDSVGYHEELDHYGIKLGGGNMFEWAKDQKTNDKDMVFVLNPEPFIAAGVDPAKVSPWLFAKINVKEADGKKVAVDKFLRPYNLE
jgi:hypothetical protein